MPDEDRNTTHNTSSKRSRLPFVKFPFSKGFAGSSFLLSSHNEENTAKAERLAVSFESGKVHLEGASQNTKSTDISKWSELKNTSNENHLNVLSSVGLFKKMRSVNSKHKVEASDGDSDSIASCSTDERPKGRREKKTSESVLSQKRLEMSAAASDRESVGSNESAWRTEKSRLSAIIDKAKSKGRKLVSSHKNKKDSDGKESVDEASQIISVGEDALEADVDTQSAIDTTVSSIEGSKSRSTFIDWFATKDEDNCNGSHPQPFFFHFLIARIRDMPLMRHRFIIFIALVAITYCSPGFMSGFLWGLYISFVGFLFFFVAEPVKKGLSLPEEVLINISKEIEEKKISKNILYEGWMNELRGRYDSASYHVNQAQTVLVRLDGNFLRVSRPARSVMKHAFHTDPTFTEAVPTFTSQSIYDLTGAEISLRPKRLARRRWWSRKYPIHIRLLSKDKETTAPALRKTFSVQETVEVAVSASEEEHSDAESAAKQGQRQMVDETQGYDSEESSAEDLPKKPKRMRRRSRASSVDDIHCGPHSTKAKGPCLHFFLRSAREKERWFHRLRETCSKYAVKADESSGNDRKENDKKDVSSLLRRASLPSFMEGSSSVNINFEYFLYISNYVQFKKSISEVVKSSMMRKQNENGDVCMDLGRNKWSSGEPDTDSQLVMSANALAARIFYDFCRDSYWVKQVQNKIQSKLATVHLPYFIETLELSSLNLGIVSPEIKAVYAPILDDWGLWIDFQMKYRGGIHLALETKVNLMKLKQGMQKSEVFREVNKMKSSVRVHHYSDSDLPESPESSPDEDFGSKTEKPITAKESTGKKILNVVDKIASSNIFQGASELKPVKKMMEEISSTRLLLNVDVTHLEGIMTFNIPPPPSDRLWYAFRTPPKLSIRSVPQVGDRSVDMTTVSSWIENKLRLLLEKFLVCPNMDDIIVPVMSGNELLKRGYNN